MRDLEGKAAVVTGGGAGIGRAIALVFAEAGASVVIPDLSLEAAEETAGLVRAMGNPARALRADVSRPDEVDKIFDTALGTFGKVDILINNAGTTHPTVSILDLDLGFVDRIFSVDYKGVYLCCRRAVKEMSRQGDGCIVNISSIAGMTPMPLLMYGPMKAAVNMLTRILAREWAGHHIRVNAVAPGYVLTPLIQTMIEKGQRDPSLILRQTPMKTMLEPRDIARAVLFLSSSAARFITGAILPVDAGWLSDGGWAAYPREPR
jgi:NAD(P)-dependent dehydrogenase (short-subunit alcohol dehydrogenase family)